MKTIYTLAASAALLVIGSAANAADVIYDVPPAPTAPIAPVVYDWTGFYVGLQAGYGWTKVDLPAGFGEEDFDGFTLGAHVGANWQSGAWVFGIEGDINYNWNENTYLGAIDVGTDWSGSVRGRVGYAIDRTLIYGTGGFAITNGYVDGAGLDESETLTGWTLGAGVEYAFAENWTGRLEYRYSDYGSDDFGLGLGDFDVTEHAVRVGVSYKF